MSKTVLDGDSESLRKEPPDDREAAEARFSGSVSPSPLVAVSFPVEGGLHLRGGVSGSLVVVVGKGMKDVGLAVHRKENRSVQGVVWDGQTVTYDAP